MFPSQESLVQSTARRGHVTGGRSERSKGGDGIIKGKSAACLPGIYVVVMMEEAVVLTTAIVASDEIVAEDAGFCLRVEREETQGRCVWCSGLLPP